MRGSLRTSAGNIIQEVLILLWAEGLKPGAILLLLGKRESGWSDIGPRDRGRFLKTFSGWIQLHLTLDFSLPELTKISFWLEPIWAAWVPCYSKSPGTHIQGDHQALLAAHSTDITHPCFLAAGIYVLPQSWKCCISASQHPLQPGHMTLPWSMVSKEKIAED